MLKVGDRVLFDDSGYKSIEGTITLTPEMGCPSGGYVIANNFVDGGYGKLPPSPYIIKIDNEKKSMNIKEQFVLALTPEPQRTFRKTGITNGDNILTDDGVKIFLTWLLTQNQDKFKTEVVDGLLAEQEKEKK